MLLGITCILLAKGFGVFPDILVSLGAVLFATGTIEIGMVRITAKQTEESIESAVESIESVLENHLQKPVVAVYEKREDSPHIADQSNGAEAVWCAWHSGRHVTINNIAQNTPEDADLRLVLPAPNPHNLRIHSAATGGTGGTGGIYASPETLHDDILNTTQEAIDVGFDVRWVPHLIHNSVNILNPNQEDAQAEIELFLPRMGPEDRPNVQVSPKAGSQIFESYKKMYEKRLWKQGEQPPEDKLYRDR
ncbi:hypothetical protein NGM10_14305 [Halorussus salilacus]|uniref:hypothetical protein n=1 Tax=Halorussus salilacus TaxID=2953750 RepID=UPI00209CF7A0|nr:hypothetical protein [Halorussus salilacus]USZ67892.1 hypothetical protein NGM10_14305 [Halorussus salilacus]